MRRSAAAVDLERDLSYVVDDGGGVLDRADLRSAMLRHERVFRCQVLELHRLYWAQMNLMGDVDVGSCGGGSRPSPHLFSPSPVKEMQEMPPFMHRPLMSGQTANARDSFAGVPFRSRPDLWRTFDVLSVDNSSYNRIGFGKGELESNLGVSNDGNGGSRNALMNFSRERGCLRRPEVINLEEDPPEMEIIREEQMLVSPSAMKTPVPHRETKGWSVLRGLSDNDFCGKPEKYSVDMHSKCLPFPGQEIGSAKSGNLIPSSQRRPMQIEAPFDLNVPQPEDPPTVENTCVDFILSGGSFNSTRTVEDRDCRRNVKENRSKNETNDFLIGGLRGSSFEETCTMGGVNSSHDSNSMVINGTTKSSYRGSLELNRVASAEGMQPSFHGSSLTSSNSYNLRIVNADRYTENQVSGSDFKRSELDFLSLLRTSNSSSLPVKALEGKRLEHENSDEDTLSSKIHGGHELHLNVPNLLRQQLVSPVQLRVGENSESVIDLNCDSMECHDLEDGVHPGASRIVDLDTTVMDACSALDNPNTQSHGVISHEGKCCGHDALQAGDQLTQGKRQVEEWDNAVLMAAQCLNFMASKTLKSKELLMSVPVADEMSDQPQCSSDSLEQIVLSLPENQEGECSMPTRHLEEERAPKASRFNSRRGRQLRDFQKDILPGIVSLSRHEICEDMHAFTEIARLHRATRKEKPGNIYKQNWPTTARKRRLRCH